VGTKLSSHTHIIDLTRTRIHRLEQLVNLLITHLLPQIRQNVPQLPHTNEARHIFVKHLKAATIVFGIVEIAEATRTIEDAREGVKVNWNISLA